MVQIVGHMDKMRPRSIDPIGRFDGLLDRKVGRMRAMTKRIKHKRLGWHQSSEGFFRDMRDIGALGQREQIGFCVVRRLKKEPKDGELAVVECDGGDGEPEEGEGDKGLDDVGDELGNE